MGKLVESVNGVFDSIAVLWQDRPDVDRMKASRDIQGLMNAMDQRYHIESRRRAAYALGHLRDPWAVRALVSHLNDHDAEVRKGSASSLGYIGDPRAVEPLLRAAIDLDCEVRDLAVESLVKLGMEQEEISSRVEEIAKWLSRDLATEEKCEAVAAMQAFVEETVDMASDEEIEDAYEGEEEVPEMAADDSEEEFVEEPDMVLIDEEEYLQQITSEDPEEIEAADTSLIEELLDLASDEAEEELEEESTAKLDEPEDREDSEEAGETEDEEWLAELLSD